MNLLGANGGKPQGDDSSAPTAGNKINGNQQKDIVMVNSQYQPQVDGEVYNEDNIYDYDGNSSPGRRPVSLAARLKPLLFAAAVLLKFYM